MKTQTNETKHTPGPWKQAGLAIYGPFEKRSFGGPIREYFRPICTAERADDGREAEYVEGNRTGSWTNTRLPDDEEANANAQLIAAAPELLEALRAIVNGAVRISHLANDQLSEHDPKVIAARAAIGKATGREY